MAVCNQIYVLPYKTLVECNMKHSDEVIKMVKAFGYTEEEAINILDGKNPDGTKFIEIPF